MNLPPYLMVLILPSGEFCAHRSVIGVSSEEMDEMIAGRVRQMRMEQINCPLIDQLECLREAEPAGRC